MSCKSVSFIQMNLQLFKNNNMDLSISKKSVKIVLNCSKNSFIKLIYLVVIIFTSQRIKFSINYLLSNNDLSISMLFQAFYQFV